MEALNFYRTQPDITTNELEHLKGSVGSSFDVDSGIESVSSSNKIMKKKANKKLKVAKDVILEVVEKQETEKEKENKNDKLKERKKDKLNVDTKTHKEKKKDKEKENLNSSQVLTKEKTEHDG